jgi:O-antigen ligase
MYGFIAGLLRMGAFSGGRFQLLTGNFDPNDTAYVLLALFPVCLYYVQFREGMLKKIVAIAAICGSVSTIFLTGSRGGVLAFAAVLIVLLLTRTGGIRKGYKLLFAAVFALGLVLVKDKIDIDRYSTVSHLSTDYNVTEEGGRIALWGEAMELALSNPILGVGVNCYASAGYYARIGSGGTYQTWHAVHNSFLQIAAELGLVAFVVFLLMNVRSISTFLRISRSKQESPEITHLAALAGLMLLGFIGVLISGFFLSHGYSIFLTFYFALAAVMARMQAQASPAPGRAPPRPHVGAQSREQVLVEGEFKGRTPIPRRPA